MTNTGEYTRRQDQEQKNVTAGEALPPLSPQRAFVVQFRDGPVGGLLSGRVEHLTSGQTLRFQSLEQLLEFLTHTLAQVPDKPP